VRRFLRSAFVVLLIPALGGCQLFQGLTQSVGSVLSLAISLAIIAIPFVLTYYHFHQHIV